MLPRFSGRTFPAVDVAHGVGKELARRLCVGGSLPGELAGEVEAPLPSDGEPASGGPVGRTGGEVVGEFEDARSRQPSRLELT